MKCNVQWNRDFIDTNMSKTWRLNDYKKHRENILIDREKSLLPATVPFVEMEKERRERDKMILELVKKKEELNKQVNEITRLINDIRYTNYRRPQGDDGAGPSEERRQFIRACVMPDCRGFLSNQWKCGICTTWVCPDCHEPKASQKDENHKCEPNNVETAKLLAKDSKACPKCASLIFKIDGCFAKDTPILMWDGTTKMSQDIKEGDILVGDDGNPRTVQETCHGEDNMYKVDQNNGNSYTVNSKHTLMLKLSGDREIYLDESMNSWRINWFDSILNKIKSKDVMITNDVTNERAKEELDNFKANLVHSYEIEMSVDKYIRLNKDVQKNLMGYKCNTTAQHNNIIMSELTVSHNGKGQYYGWKTDGNQKFVLPDMTCVHNCDQMWCIMCQTPFSWKTGREIITTNIHNPEYYRYIREKNGGVIPRNPGDLPMACGGLPAYHIIRPFIAKWQSIDKRLEKVATFHRVIGHIQGIEINNNPYNALTNNQDMRVSYLLNEISQEASTVP